MNTDYIKANIQEAVYTKKEGTVSSFYWQGGSTLLPNRMSITKGLEMAKAERKGRNLIDPVVGQMKGQFKKHEASALKKNKPFYVTTQIWKKVDFPLLTGYGTIGISTPEGVRDTHDLVVFLADEGWNTMHIYICSGMGTPEYIVETMQVVYDIVKNSNQ